MPRHTPSQKQETATPKSTTASASVHQSRPSPVYDFHAARTGTATPHEVAQLQQTIGNRAVQRLMQPQTVQSPVIQRVYDPDEKVNSEPHLPKIRLVLLEEFTDTTFVDNFMARHPLIGEIKSGKEVPLGRIVFTARTVKQKQAITAAKTDTAIPDDLKGRLKSALQERLNRDRPSSHEEREFLDTNRDNSDVREKGKVALNQFRTVDDGELELFVTQLLRGDTGAQTLATTSKNFPLLVNYCYGRWQRAIQKGESYFVDDSEKGPHELTLRGREMTSDVPDIALGYTWVPDFKPEQLEAMKIGTEQGVSNIPSSVTSKVQTPTLSKMGTDHHLQDFVKGLEESDVSKHPVYFHQWVEWGLATKFDVYDNWKPWQRAFDSAVEGVLKLGGKIYFNLAGFPKFEIDQVRQSKFYLPWHNAKDPDKSFSKEHSRKGMVPGTSLGIGLRITHWEIAQVMHNKNMWDNTVFMYYEKSTKTPRVAEASELTALGIEFLGDSPDLNPV